MAAADAVPMNRPGDASRRMAAIEAALRELRAALPVTAPAGVSSSSPLSNVALSTAGQTTPPVSTTVTVPAGATSMTGFAGCSVSAMNGTTRGGTLSVAVRLRTDTSSSTSSTQSTPVTAGAKGQVTSVRADTLTGLTPGQVITWDALVWTDAGTWPADPSTVADLEVAVTWAV